MPMPLSCKASVRNRRSAYQRRVEACLALGLVIVLLLVTSAELSHLDSSAASATCAICHFAHMRALSGPAQQILTISVAFTRMTVARAVVSHPEPSFLVAVPRAPPA
jgi:hypothetical protein